MEKNIKNDEDENKKLEKLPPNIIDKQTKYIDQDRSSQYGTNKPEEKIERKFLIWGIFSIPDIIQILLLVVNIGMLIAFINSSSEQHGNTLIALKKTEDANMLTQKSIEQTERIALASDSATRRSLFIAESSLIISGENIKTIRDNAKVELKGYLFIDSVYFHKFEIGERPIIGIKTVNVGKTPIDSLKFEAKVNIRDKFFNAKSIYPTTITGDKSELTIYGVIDHILNEIDSLEIMNGNAQIYISYKFTYADIFSQIDSLMSEAIFIPKYNIWSRMEREPEYYKIFY